MGYSAPVDRTDGYVLISKADAERLAELEHDRRELVDEVAILRAELRLVTEDRDDLLRRLDAVEGIWRGVRRRRPPKRAR